MPWCFEDAERPIGDWNGRQARRTPVLFAPTICAALAACYRFLWVCCPACRTTQAVELVRLSPMSIADERGEHGRRLRKP
jgi:hypothetical protein